MYVVRETFTAKPGMASKLAALFKDIFSTMSTQKGVKSRVLTDSVGQFNTVVIETEVPEFSTFEKLMQEYATRTDVRDRMKGYTDMYVSGRREIYQVV